MYTEDDLVPLSSLQHFQFCPRQCALIHIEQLWAENQFTAEGKVLHERVDEEHRERRRLTRTEYSLPVRSLDLGVSGICDLVEFRLRPEGGYEVIVPVEYKRGSDKESDIDRVQLCAQALCLEQMFGAPVTEGQFYYLKDHRRTKVGFTMELRRTTVETAAQVHALLDAGKTPRPVYEKAKCDRCSLFDSCLPKAMMGTLVHDYLRTHA